MIQSAEKTLIQLWPVFFTSEILKKAFPRKVFLGGRAIKFITGHFTLCLKLLFFSTTQHTHMRAHLFSDALPGRSQYQQQREIFVKEPGLLFGTKIPSENYATTLIPPDRSLPLPPTQTQTLIQTTLLGLNLRQISWLLVTLAKSHPIWWIKRPCLLPTYWLAFKGGPIESFTQSYGAADNLRRLLLCTLLYFCKRTLNCVFTW